MQGKVGNSDQEAVAGADIARPSAGLAKISAFALHPFLFAGASVFRLYASNLRELYFSDVTTALAVAFAAALLLLLMFGAVFRNLGPKAGILASAVFVAGLFYTDIVDAANRHLGLSLSPDAALPVILVVLAAIIVAVGWLRVDLAPAAIVLNCISVAVFIPPAWQVASHSWKAGAISPMAAEAVDETAYLSDVPSAGLTATENKPDIYYFIFDRYGSDSVLADYYGFDNSELTGFLEEAGFYVASGSQANYLKTAHSLASTFHMGYLDFLKEDPRSKNGDWHPIYDMLRDHRVGRFLKSSGYKFLQIGAWWGQTQRNPYADENYSFGFSEFDNRYLRKTIIRPMLDAVAPTSTYARRLQWDNGQCQRVPQQIEKVKEIGKRKEATFVFAHILVPHDPYVFSPDGRCLSPEEAFIGTEQENYIKQIRYANLLIKDFVSALLATDGPKPIIIIQADEGPFPTRYRSGNLPWHEATVDELKAKMGILSAWYFPDGDYRDLDQRITPVNTFRILFNKYFGTELERLPDRIYAFPEIFSIYDFYDITETVRTETN